MRLGARLVLALCLALAMSVTACGDRDTNSIVPGPTPDASGDGETPDEGGDDPGTPDEGGDPGTPDEGGDPGPDPDGGPDGGPDADPDGGPDGGPDVPTLEGCEEPIAPAASGVCDIEAGSDEGAILIRGDLLLPDGLLEAGSLLVVDGVIQCTGCDCADQAAAANATVISCAEGVVSPGLINAHDHIGFSEIKPAAHTDMYDHRHEWRKGKNGKQKLSTPFNNGPYGNEIGELRHLLAGATAIFGSKSGDALLRNVDVKSQLLGIDVVPAEYQTFPLGDSGGELLTSGCGYDYKDLQDEVDNENAYVHHMAEGIIDAARNEFLCGTGQSGTVDFFLDTTGMVHGIGLKTADISTVAGDGSALIWSPRSNVSLYGFTANAPIYDRLGALIALGTDWAASGSATILREVACADRWNRDYWEGHFSDADIVAMVTHNAAEALGVGQAIGSLLPGKAADITIWNGAVNQGFRAVIDADLPDVVLVLRGGEPLHGDPELVGGLSEAGECETVDICGADKALCLPRELNLTLADLESSLANDDYGIVFCGVPSDEPTCIPARPGEFDGIPKEGDGDGDGIADADDLCPGTFSAVRPIDDGEQPDADGDGEGDECDPCPFDADTTACTSVDPADGDLDTVSNWIDNCPTVPNEDQLDADSDGQGDACDVCPDFYNPPGVGCPATIYSVKKGEVDLGTPVTIPDALVTAAGFNSFFVQVDPASDTYEGADFSGAYVYSPIDPEQGEAQPPVGARISLTAVVNDYFGQTQLINPNWTVLEAGAGVPEPLAIDPADAAVGGAKEAAYDALLVTVSGVSVTDDDPPGEDGESIDNEFLITGGLSVDDQLYLIDPQPVSGQPIPSLTGVLRYNWNRNKLLPRGPEDVDLGPPALLGFGPSVVSLYEGQVGAPIPPLVLELNTYAKEDLAIAISSSDPGVAIAVGGSVTVPDGERDVEVLIDAVGAGTATLTAELGGDTLSVDVVVYPADAQALPSAIVPDPGVVTLGGTPATFTVLLDKPAPPTGQVVSLSATGVEIDHPATVTVEAGMSEASFDIVAVEELGGATLTATVGDTSVSVEVDVIEATLYGLLLVEVFYNPDGDDGGKEWIKLYNATGGTVDLSGWSVGYGGTDYTYGVQQLTGSVPNGACFLVGGPTSDATNGSPEYDATLAFNPNIQNSGSTADGIALFDVPKAQVTASTVPADAVVYGGSNDSGLIGPDGEVSIVHVDEAPKGQSLMRTDFETWVVHPTPNSEGCITID